MNLSMEWPIYGSAAMNVKIASLFWDLHFWSQLTQLGVKSQDSVDIVSR